MQMLAKDHQDESGSTMKSLAKDIRQEKLR